MDKIDALIKGYYENRKSRVSGRREEGLYPTTEILVDYLSDKLDGLALERMLDFLKNDADAQALVSKARELMDNEGGWENENVPVALTDRAKGLMPAKNAGGACPHCGKAITPFKKPLRAQKWANLLWFFLALGAFALSFKFQHHFMQFLTVAALAGVKGIVEMRSTRTQIMIYKALSDDSAPEQDRLHQHSSRL